MRATVNDMRASISTEGSLAYGRRFSPPPRLPCASRTRAGACKRRWALYLTTCGAAVLLASCIATKRDGNGSVRAPQTRADAGQSAQLAASATWEAPVGGGTFTEAPSSSNWLPPESETLTRGSARVTGGHALNETGSGTPLLDRWSRSGFRPADSASIREQYEESLLDVDNRHSWSIDVDGDAVDERRWRGRFAREDIGEVVSFTGKGSLADGLSLAVKGESVEHADYGGEEIAGFWLDRSDKWKKGTNSDFLVSLGVLEDRLRFTTRHAFSRYEDHDMTGEETGNALAQRVEADVLKTEDFRVGFFGSYARTEEDYTSLDDLLDDKDVKKRLKERNKQGEFADPGRERTKFGTTLGLGPLDLTLASVSEHAFAGKDEGDVESGYEAKVSLDVEDLTGSLGDVGENVWIVVPRWIYGSYEIRQVDVADSSADDSTSYASVGAGWNWENAYLNVDYWRFFVDKRQPGEEDGGWLGDGLDVSAGYYVPEWSIYAGYSRTRANSFGSWRETEIGHSAWLSFSVRPEDLPDFKASFSTYLYGGDYPNSASDYEDWSLSAELDFSKYLEESPLYDSSLALVAQFDQERFDYGWSGGSTTDDASDFFVGLRYELSPKR